MTAFIYYHKQFSLSTIFQCFLRNFFKFFSKLFSSQNVVFALGLHHNLKLAYCLRQLAYNNPLRFFCKAFLMFFVIFLVLFNSSNYRTYCPSKPLFSVCLGTFGDRLPPNSDKNHSPMTHRCKNTKTVSSHHVITLSRATLYIAYARVYVCGYMRMRIHAYAYTRVRAYYNI